MNGGNVGCVTIVIAAVVVIVVGIVTIVIDFVVVIIVVIVVGRISDVNIQFKTRLPVLRSGESVLRRGSKDAANKMEIDKSF